MSTENSGRTQEELTKSIKTSWAAVEASGVPDEMRKVAFRRALDSLLLTAQPVAGPREQPAASSRDHPEVRSGEGADDKQSAVSETEVMELVAQETGVSVSTLERVLLIDEGVVKLIGQHTKYGSGTAEQARTVAQIVTVVRKIGMGFGDTSFEVIKAACESKHCYDSKNFASLHMPKIEGFVIKGEKKNRRLEARGPGIAAFPSLIDRILAAV